MTIKELIMELSQYDENKEVRIYDDERGFDAQVKDVGVEFYGNDDREYVFIRHW